ncbi:hypothetical protein ACVWY2_002502 [Bradyrhizobium sp. JR6.1]
MRTSSRSPVATPTGIVSPANIPRDSNKAMSDQEFTSLIANVCPSERQNFRVSLIDFLSLQFPKQDADVNLTTANRAIELAQKDIVTAFTRRRAAAK